MERGKLSIRVRIDGVSWYSLVTCRIIDAFRERNSRACVELCSRNFRLAYTVASSVGIHIRERATWAYATT